MNIFGECPVKGADIVIESGPMAGEVFQVEDWARNVMAKGIEWPSDLRNSSVLMFWMHRQDLLKGVQASQLEYFRTSLTGLYGHIGMYGHLMMPEELGIEVD